MNNEGESPQAPTNPGRRRAIKLLAGSALGIAAGAIITKEAQAKPGSFQISDNSFIPLLERHDTGTRKEDVPTTLTTIFIETSLDTRDFIYTPQQLISRETAVPDIRGSEIKINLFQEGVLEKLAQNSIRVMFGDVALGISIKDLRLMMLLPTFLTGFCAMVAHSLYLQREENKNEEKKLTRRNILKGLPLAGVAVWGISPPLTDGSILASTFLGKEQPISNILGRLRSMESNFHPEDLYNFFRSVVMADKILTVTERSNLEGKKEEFGFKVGYQHENIKDLLRVGPDFCRFLISQYPKIFLEHIVMATGSLENFCTSRIITLSKDFQTTDLTNPAKATGFKEEKVIDEKLFHVLKQKLA